MISELAVTPPFIAWMLGFFMALALKRGRVEKIIDRIVPTGGD